MSPTITEARFCQACGSKLTSGQRACASCDAATQPQFQPNPANSTRAKLTRLGVLVGLVGLAALFFGMLSALRPTPRPRPSTLPAADESDVPPLADQVHEAEVKARANKIIKAVPPDQLAFCRAVVDGHELYAQAEAKHANELTLSRLRTQRAERFRGMSIDPARYASVIFKKWVGEVRTLRTTSDGRAVVGINLLCDKEPYVSLTTWNNSVSDHRDRTLIPQASPLFSAFEAFSIGDFAVVSGELLTDASGQDAIRESSVSERGSMLTPDFIVRFSAVEALPL